ncbi:MAG: hypothetical protein HeimC2_10480 [Candidatus Heimdallarchaeota archaeon LC_2]|nr:MAG: hypothetical protein HeimC2_10480 [Candidatus Heimdallarchaeota archaeon LC_2]
MDLFREAGINIETLWSTALELHSKHPFWSEEQLKGLFFNYISIYSKDINVNSVIFAAFELEKLGSCGAIFGLSKEDFEQDPVHLLADEMLGIALSQYISGTKGVFNFTRYDRKKPGILKKLGPFIDDIVAALIGSIMSNIYTKLLEEP